MTCIVFVNTILNYSMHVTIIQTSHLDCFFVCTHTCWNVFISSFPQIWNLFPKQCEMDTCVSVHLVNDLFCVCEHNFNSSVQVIITLHLTLGLFFCMLNVDCYFVCCMLNDSVCSTQAIFYMHFSDRKNYTTRSLT